MTDVTTDRRLTRRAAIGAISATATIGATSLVGAARQAATPEDHTHTGATPAADAIPDPATLPEVTAPEVISSSDGVLEVPLNAHVAVVEMGVGHPVTTYTYNGMVPAPTWEVSPGDTMRIHLVNDLPEIPDGQDPHDPVRPHAWTTTNLHTHGLHVSPEGNSDNVFLEIGPGEEFDFEIEIPDDHHRRALLVSPAQARRRLPAGARPAWPGALIVRGEIDEVPEITAAKEQVLVFQAIELETTTCCPNPSRTPVPTRPSSPAPRYFYTVNGAVAAQDHHVPG